MPGNVNGVAKYVTGYLATKERDQGRILPCTKASSIDEISGA